MNTQTLEQHVIKTTHTHGGETFNASFDVTEFVPLLKEMDNKFSRIRKRTVDKLGFVGGNLEVIGGEDFPIFEVDYQKDYLGLIVKRYQNEIEKTIDVLDKICKEMFTVDFFDSGACVIGMQVEIQVLLPKKRKATNITLVSQYGQGEGFNYVYQRRVLQLIEKYIPSMFPYVKTNCGRMD